MSDGFDQNRLLGPADDVSILAVTLHRRRDRPDNTCQAALIAATAKKVAFPVCRSFDPTSRRGSPAVEAGRLICWLVQGFAGFHLCQQLGFAAMAGFRSLGGLQPPGDGVGVGFVERQEKCVGGLIFLEFGDEIFRNFHGTRRVVCAVPAAIGNGGIYCR